MESARVTVVLVIVSVRVSVTRLVSICVVAQLVTSRLREMA